MRLLFTIVISALSLNAIAQSNNPYFNPDSNGDSFIGVDDILAVLSAYDNAWSYNMDDVGSGVRSWTCGDPWRHQGYWYSTVEIGEQCWFQENLRVRQYPSIDVNGNQVMMNIPFSHDSEAWATATDWMIGWSQPFGNGIIPHFSPELDDFESVDDWMLFQENNFENGTQQGLLYNYYAVEHEYQNVCPTGWHIPNHSEWLELQESVAQTYAGVSIYEISSYNDDDMMGGWGTVWDGFPYVGDELKSLNFFSGMQSYNVDLWDGTHPEGDWNLSGFSAQASWYRQGSPVAGLGSPGDLVYNETTYDSNGNMVFNDWDFYASWWVADSEQAGDMCMVAKVSSQTDVLQFSHDYKHGGYSVRCVKGCPEINTIPGYSNCCDCWCTDFDMDGDGICDSVDDCVLDAMGVCGGGCEFGDEDGNGICDDDED